MKSKANTSGNLMPDMSTGTGVVKPEDMDELRTEILDKIEMYDRKADERQIRSIESLGVFVALFTFVSVSIQIFNRISSVWSAGIFTFLIFFSLAMMLILMDFLLIKNDESHFFISKRRRIDKRIALLAVFFTLSYIFLWSLRTFPLNLIPGSIEFEDKFNKQINDKIFNSITKNNESYYTKLGVDDSITTKKEELDNKIKEQQVIIDNYKKLRECLKGKKYWQYEECLNNKF